MGLKLKSAEVRIQISNEELVWRIVSYCIRQAGSVQGYALGNIMPSEYFEVIIDGASYRAAIDDVHNVSGGENNLLICSPAATPAGEELVFALVRDDEDDTWKIGTDVLYITSQDRWRMKTSALLHAFGY